MSRGTETWADTGGCQSGGAPALRTGAVAQSPGREAALARASLAQDGWAECGNLALKELLAEICFPLTSTGTLQGESCALRPMILRAEQQKRLRCKEQSFGLSAACASLSSPCLLVAGAGICAASPLGELLLGS